MEFRRWLRRFARSSARSSASAQRREGAIAPVGREHLFAAEHRIVRKTPARRGAERRRHPQAAHADERDLRGRNRVEQVVDQFEVVALGARDTRSPDRDESRPCSRPRARGAPPRCGPPARPCDARSFEKTCGGESVHETSVRPRGSTVSRLSISSVLVLSSSIRLSRAAKNSTRSRLMPVIGSKASESASSPVPTRSARPGARRVAALQLVEGVWRSWRKPGSRDYRRDIPAGSSSCNPSGSSTRGSGPGIRSRRTRRSRPDRPSGRARADASRPSAACPRRTDRRRRERDVWNRERRRRNSPPRWRGRGG